MKFFIDTADVKEIRELASTGLIDGVTTNPSLISSTGRNYKEVLSEICQIIDGPISAEVTATDKDKMYKEAMSLKEISGNIVIKLPMTLDGIMTCQKLSSQNIPVNITLCFSSAQALIAAKAGATYISPFIGRLDDTGQEGIALINEICEIYNNYNFKTQILVASIRSPLHVSQAAQLGADIATIPPKILKQMIKHPLTDIGLEIFNNDWKKTGQTIY
jgi:transaldolase